MKNRIKTVIWCFAGIAISATAVGAAAMAADTGAVYTSTNNPAGTAVVVFARAADGTLTLSGTFPTGGTSIGAFGTGNQHGLLLSGDGSCLWAVNSLSNQVSAFQVNGTSLRLVDIVASGGQRPVSVAVNQASGVAYVLNAGGQVGSSDNLSGFTVRSDCRLSPLANSTRALSAPNVSPAQVSFDPSGSVVIVTEKTANSAVISPPPPVRGGAIDTFIVNIDGRLSGFKSVSLPDNITEPFGFAFARYNQLLVTAADCSQPAPPGVEPDCLVPPDRPALLSYTLSRDGTLKLIDALVDNQAGKCWIVTTQPGVLPFPAPGFDTNSADDAEDGRHTSAHQFAFTTNTLATQTGGTPDQPPAGSITGYRVNRDGSLAELGVTPIPLNPDQFPDNSRPSPLGIPTDDALSRDSRFLYVVSEVDGAISAYQVGPDGGLTPLSPPTYLITPAPPPMPNGPFATGLAAQ